MFYKFYYNFQKWCFVLVEEDGKLVFFGTDDKFYGVEIKNTPLFKNIFKQLDLYFDGKLKKFDVPLKLDGSPFQMKVWQALTKIDIGEVKTYKEIAKIVGNEKAYRAVGGACNKNKLPIFIPCHRVAGFGDDLKGYAYGVELKKVLLQIEKKFK